MATAPLLANDKCLGYGVFLGKNRVQNGHVQPRTSLSKRCGVSCCLCNLSSAIPPTLCTTNAGFLDGRKISARLRLPPASAGAAIGLELGVLHEGFNPDSRISKGDGALEGL